MFLMLKIPVSIITAWPHWAKNSISPATVKTALRIFAEKQMIKRKSRPDQRKR
jgi:Fe2+ or Zn2+ uptake regulation protein